MAVVTPAPRTRGAQQTQTRRPDLRVVRANERVRAVGTLGTIAVAMFMVVLLVLAGLHAVLVQTQAQLDSLNAEISHLEVQRNEGIAKLAWHDSPDGLAEAAVAAGLVHATDLRVLGPVTEGRLSPPVGADPFGGVAG